MSDDKVKDLNDVVMALMVMLTDVNSRVETLHALLRKKAVFSDDEYAAALALIRQEVLTGVTQTTKHLLDEQQRLRIEKLLAGYEGKPQ
jgi:hypothetical protein